MGLHKITLARLQATSLLDAGSAAYLEQLYDDYLKNPASIIQEWREYFEQLPTVTGNGSEISHQDIQDAFKTPARQPNSGITPSLMGTSVPADFRLKLAHEQKQGKVRELIDAYRLLGHLEADIDPLKLRPKAIVPELMLSYYHFSETDLKTTFDTDGLPGPRERLLEEIINDLKRTYCETLASEFMHIPDSPERIWIQTEVEALGVATALPVAIKHRLLECLLAAEGLEKYLGAKYPGAKRFSLEGTDSLIVALETAIQEGGIKGAKEIVICMAHRGRLNVLVNLLGKMPSQLFDEFEGKHYDVKLESGDVKYHQGFSSNLITPGGSVHVALAFNPSHLEIVTPVVCGSVKARQERRKDFDHKEVLSIAVHGDSAFCGQGVVMETLNMSQTRGFKIGGTIHIIVDNQIGFTTSNTQDSRSTLYCSDLGKMLNIPIFHVNADDPEAVYRALELGLRYRNQFKKDIIIDLVGYRRQGHNEADEPAATQPLMYQLIRQLPTAFKLYADKLVAEKIITEEEIQSMVDGYRATLENRQQPVAKNLLNETNRDHMSDWQPYVAKDWRIAIKTGVPLPTLRELAEKQLMLPEGFVLHPRVQKVIENRQKMTVGALPVDWGYAETMAYATLLNDGYLIRISGQDVARGTFFHRHAVLYNQTNGEEYVPLRHLSSNQGYFYIINSLLSEQAVLAFEYGFAKTDPRALVIWEAQFGDFANGAQVVIDQFISSGEQKWGILCGLILFLPHGYEGQGAEHSSARLERYLQLCANGNMQICIPSTPAQVFHMLRRQILRPIRKPLIALTPKGFLRHKLASSTLQELSEGAFLPILPETANIAIENVKKVILCSGKIYYELFEKRAQQNRTGVVIIRIEQLYPFPDIELKALLAKYNKAVDIVWCQEEPKNQGAWYSIQHHVAAALNKDQQLRYAGREASAAPAVGYHHLHEEQQIALIEDALR